MEPCQFRYELNDAGVLRRGTVMLALGVFVLFKALRARSATVEIPSLRTHPSGVGISFHRTGDGMYVPSRML